MAKYSVGIDLGTTNSSLAWIDTSQPVKKINFLPISQLVSEGELTEKVLLPSFIFLPQSFEISEGGLNLPWDSKLDYAVGEIGLRRSVSSASRVVSSAKSWLCHSRVDRRAEILPWGAAQEDRKISPLEAFVRFLTHIKNAWNSKMASEDSQSLLEKQDIVVTVPASFDETARELVAEAVRICGITNFSLLEEPQAAFYCWLLENESMWKRELREVSNILVCDVGGGTTDFSLINVGTNDDEVFLKRVAVGDHLLLGGDNMDMSLAHKVERKTSGLSVKMDSMMWASLCRECRYAKERLLASDETADSVPITLLGRGSRLVGNSVMTELSRADVESAILDGFFPEIPFDEAVSSPVAGGLMEWGLPYEKNPSVTSHMVSFIKNHIKDGVLPDAIMFNGGVFTPKVIRQRIVELLQRWRGDKVRVLENDSLDLAVSAGAAYFGLVKSGAGVRIGGGSPRSYYVKLDSSSDDTFLCLIPKDLMTETVVEIKEKEFMLMLERPVSFSLYSSNKRFEDLSGDLINIPVSELYPLPPLFTVLKSSGSGKDRTVFLRSWITEIGTLEMWCVARDSDEKWQLRFSLDRFSEAAENEPAAVVGSTQTLDQGKLAETKKLIESAFRKGSDIKPRGLFSALEDLWGQKREDFPLSLDRNIFDAMLAVISKRRSDELSESSWFNVAGFALRPGFGFPLDEWRIERVKEILGKWLQYNKDTKCRLEWWIFWRRCAAGLSAEEQEFLFERISPWLFAGRKHIKTFSGPPPSKIELTEILRMASVLEKISVSSKKLLGDYIFSALAAGRDIQFFCWCLARVAGRVPFSGPVNLVIAGDDVAKWIESLLSINTVNDSMLMALSRMSAMTGDRHRDIGDDLRNRVIDFLNANGAPESYIKPVEEIVEEELIDSDVLFGEALPSGLILKN